MTTRRRGAFRRWRSERPFWGALLIALGGIEEFFSGQLDIGKIHIQLGLEGLQALIIPAVLLLLGILIALMPVHRIFYGIIALVLAIYSLIGVNLGGFVIGMLLAAIGGVLVVAWMPREAVAAAQEAPAQASAPPEPTAVADDRDVDDLLGGLDSEPEADASGTGTAAEADDTSRRSSKPHRRRWLKGGAAAAVAGAVLGIAAIAPQPAHAATTASEGAAQSGCVLLVLCSPSSSSPSPSPSSAPSSNPSPSSGGSSPTAPTIGTPNSPVQITPGGSQVAVPGQDRSSAPAAGQTATSSTDLPPGDTTSTPLAALGDDNSHGIFTLPSATTDGDSLQLSGASQVGVVSVPLADGTRATAIRIECARLTIGAFHLDTKNRKEVANLNTDSMTLSGHVVVWIDRIGTQYGASESLAQSLAANPLTLGQLMTLLGQGHVVLGLVGAQADGLSYSNFELTASVQSTGK